MNYDVVILGGGPGGYPAAIRLARAGLRVALVEKDKVGGECTNYGCVPTKALSKYALTLMAMNHLGIESSRRPIEYLNDALEYSRKIAREVSDSIINLLTSLGVDVYNGRGRIVEKRAVSVNGERLVWEKALILSTGSEPFNPFNVEVDGIRVHDNRSILSWNPDGVEDVTVIGGGYIGVEYAFILSAFGLRVKIIEVLDRLLPLMDKDFGLLARRILAKLGVKIQLRSPVSSISMDNGGRVKIKAGGVEQESDAVLIAIGRKPRNAEAQSLGIRVDQKGYVKVDSCGHTNIEGIYAVGDLTGPPLLAHKAIHQSVNAAECILGNKAKATNIIPSVLFGPLDFVSVGYTLSDATSHGIKAVEVRIPTGGLAKSRIHGIIDGFVKVVFEKPTRRIIGLHMAFPTASEVAATATTLVSIGVRIDDALEIVFPHPTMSEAIEEVVNAAIGRPIHVKGARIREN